MKAKGRACAEIRGVLDCAEKSRVIRLAAIRLRSPMVKIKRRGQRLWLHLHCTLPDGTREKKVRCLHDKNYRLKSDPCVDAWIALECIILTDDVINGIRQREFTIEGKPL